MKKLYLESLLFSFGSLVVLMVTNLWTRCWNLIPMDVILSSLLLIPPLEGWTEAAMSAPRKGNWLLAGGLIGESLLRLFLLPALSRACPWLHPIYFFSYSVWLTSCGYLRSCRRVLFTKRHRMFLDYVQQKNRSILMLMMAIGLLSPQLGLGTELSRTAWSLLMLLTLVAWFALALSVRDGRMPVFASGRVKEIYHQLCGREVPSNPAGGDPDDLEAPTSAQVESEKAERQLYMRCIRYMRDLKPFLDPHLKLLDLCGRLGTNKVYLSKTINAHSGRAFPSFVNFFRVQYSIALFKGNRGLRVHELSDRAGFNSTVTFNTAFKFETGFTPGEYCALFRDGGRLPAMPEYPSRSRGVER